MTWNQIAAQLNTRPMIGLIVVIAITLLAAIVVGQIGVAVMRRAARGRLPLVSVVEASTRPALWAWYLLTLQSVLTWAPPELEFIGPVQHLVSLALIAVLTWFGVQLARATCETIVARYSQAGTTNIHARQVRTLARLTARTLIVAIVTIGLAIALMTFPTVRQVGASLLASAGLAGIIVGFAARPLFGNLLAGLQIALTQPIRLDDVVIVEGEWGVIEQIRSTYVVVRIWDDRRMVLPLQWFIDTPFQNWTVSSSEITGTVYLWVDYRTPVDPLRAELKRLCESAPEWDRRFQLLQVTDTNERAMQLRALLTSADAGKNWDLRCRVREGLLAFIQRESPEYLPRVRAEIPDSSRERRGPASAQTPTASARDSERGSHASTRQR